MATKRKATATRKARAPRPSRRPAIALPAAYAPAEENSPNGFLFVLLALGALSLGWLAFHGWRNKSIQKSPAPVLAPSPPATAVPAAPPARSAAPAPLPRAAASDPRTSAHRGTAGAEKGAPSMTYDPRLGKPLTLRCWRSEGASAQLDVFGPRNKAIRSIKSVSGAAGWVDLEWDGRDSTASKVPGGLYFLRPSQKAEQSILDVWVKE